MTILYRIINILLSAIVLTSIASLDVEHFTFLENFIRYFIRILVMITVLEILVIFVLRKWKLLSSRSILIITIYALIGVLIFWLTPAISLIPTISISLYVLHVTFHVSYWGAVGAITHYLIHIGIKHIIKLNK